MLMRAPVAQVSRPVLGVRSTPLPVLHKQKDSVRLLPMRTLPFAAFVLAAAALLGQEYSLGPDSQPQPGVPKGKVTKHTWTTSRIFPGTTRDYSVYVPSQYDGSKPACVMIFQDGSGFANETGAWRVPIVFDNLIHKAPTPATTAIFVDPRVMSPPPPRPTTPFHRSPQYHGLRPRRARL